MQKHEGKEHWNTLKHEALRSINHKTTQNKNNTGTTALERTVVYSYFMSVWGIVKTTATRCRGQLDVLLPEAERPRAIVHPAVRGTEGQ